MSDDEFFDKHFGPLRVADLAAVRAGTKVGTVVAADDDAVVLCVMPRDGDEKPTSVKDHGENCTREHVRVAGSEAVGVRMHYPRDSPTPSAE